jgi:hypothetical protein
MSGNSANNEIIGPSVDRPIMFFKPADFLLSLLFTSLIKGNLSSVKTSLNLNLVVKKIW